MCLEVVAFDNEGPQLGGEYISNLVVCGSKGFIDLQSFDGNHSISHEDHSTMGCCFLKILFCIK